MTACKYGSDALSLPGRADAERAIARLMSEGRLGFVLAIVDTRIPRINEEDGYAAGDRALAALAQRLAGPPGSARELFHWSAAAFVIVSSSLRKVTDHAYVEGATTALFGAWPGDQAPALFERIDHYIASRLACSEAA